MALDISQYETPESRLQRWQGETADGHKWYMRVYEVPEQHTSIIPAAGAQFPGLDYTDAAQPELGPYVREVKWSPSRIKSGTVKLVVQVQGRELVEDSGGNANELKGRKITKTATHYVYDTVWCFAAVDSAGIPKRGDTLANASLGHTQSAICRQVRLDPNSEPGRVMVYAQYAAPILFTENYL